jgi:DNA topoisomerase-3
MSFVFIVAEKPIMARQIADALCKKDLRPAPTSITGTSAWGPMKITWCTGHLMRLAMPEEYPGLSSPYWTAKDLPLAPPDLHFRYFPQGRHEQLDTIHEGVTTAIEVVNACDAGREGELIFAEAINYVGGIPEKTRATRMWLTNPTPRGIVEAFTGRENLRKKKWDNLARAAFARQQADWLYGINLTRYATLGAKALRDGDLPKVVVGRVQTPLLAIVYKMVQDVLRFEPTRFYRVRVKFNGRQGHYFTADLQAPKGQQFAFDPLAFSTQEFALQALTDVNRYGDALWAVKDKSLAKYGKPPPPFTLVELQRTCFRKYKWSAKYTLEVAQEAYASARVITYPRTDSYHFPERMKPEIEELYRRLWPWARKEFGHLRKLEEEPPPFSARYFSDDKVGDHHGIIPTGSTPPLTRPDGTASDVYLLWRVVAARFLVAWMPAYQVYPSVRTVLRVGTLTAKCPPAKAVFKTCPLLDAGWLRIEDAMFNIHGFEVPLIREITDKPLAPSEPTVISKGAEIIQGTTRPPHFPDPDSLLYYAEKYDLGTAATRADIIAKLFDYGLIYELPDGKLSLTVRGEKVINFIATYAKEALDYKLTGAWEKLLLRMERGAKDAPTREDFLHHLITKVETMGAALLGQPSRQNQVHCPKTALPVVETLTGFVFAGYKDQCHSGELPKTYKGREMTAEEYRDVLMAGSKGAGPYEGFFSEAKGVSYAAWLKFSPKFGTCELFFPKRGGGRFDKVKRSDAGGN